MSHAIDREWTAKRLRGFRQAVETGADLNMFFSGGESGLEWKDPITGEPTTMAIFAADIPFEQMEILACARPMLRDALAIIDHCFAIIRDMKTSRPPAQTPAPQTGAKIEAAKDYTAEACMKCTDPQFIAFLGDLGLIEDSADSDAVTDALRKTLKIKSRAELNAAGRWLTLKNDFRDWQGTSPQHMEAAQ